MTDETLSYYTSNAGRIAVRYESADVAPLQAAVLKELSAGDTVLEIGCGSGREAAFMLGHGIRVNGLDGSAQMIQQAETLHPELKGSLQHQVLPAQLPFADGVFDGTRSSAVLVHFQEKDIRTILREVFRVLRSGTFFTRGGLR